MPTQPQEGKIKIIECPRDAMQGILDFIPTKDKVQYINKLMNVGFDTLDCGSFVSPKAIPQMRDTSEVLDQIKKAKNGTKLSVIVANERGAIDAMAFKNIDFLGFPFSISETFQRRNTNSSITESLDTVKNIIDLCHKHQKGLVMYISMGFGNPYNDEWSVDIVNDWIGNLVALGVTEFSLSDTVGVSTPLSISAVFKKANESFPHLEFGGHFHTKPWEWQEKVEAAFQSGCMRFDGAIKGYGGCPMAKDDLVGNMPTERLIEYFGYEKLGIKKAPFEEAFMLAESIFNHYS
jgi:hydroxymethylglutaryl-CoA lyase